jgi:hypothetical protein
LLRVARREIGRLVGGLLGLWCVWVELEGALKECRKVHRCSTGIGYCCLGQDWNVRYGVVSRAIFRIEI